MEKSEFNERLSVVKTKLPKYYAVVLRMRHPQIKSTTAYNVVSKGSYNESVLLALEKEFLNQTNN